MLKSKKTKNCNNANTEYPCLMIGPDEDYIVLMNDENSGMVVWSEFPGFHVGLYKSNWLNCYKPYVGGVELENI